ncbi:Putative ribonuclease H protein At1g65750 [Linum perenne]
MTPPRDGAGADVLVWGLEDNGKFSVKSAYALLKDFRLDEQNGQWQKVWKWQGPNKIKHFMWIVMQGKLLTNRERMRRHLAASDICSACSQGAETLDHLFRSCRFAREVWSACLPDVLSPEQQRLNFQDWWISNVGNACLNPTFGVAAWLIWKRRNKSIFENVVESTAEVCNQVKFWVLLLSSSWKAGQLGREAPGSARQTQLIGWRPADEGWFTLDSDGSLYVQNSRAAAGGLIRDWEVQLTHVYREANCAADHLANLGHSFVIGMYLFDFPDASLAHWLRYDLIGVALPRVTLFHPKKIQIENLRNLKKPNKIVTIPTTWTPPMSNESTIS